MTKIAKNGHQKAFLIALVAVGAALILSVVSFANTSTSSSVTITVGGVGGQFGFSVGQSTLGSAVWSADSTTTVTVGDATDFSVGDFILIDDPDNGDATDGTNSYHTITAINGTTFTVDPDIGNSYGSGAGVREAAPNTVGPTWSPSIGSTSSITAGNHFVINLQGVDASDSALVEIFLTNTDELVKNYTFLHRVINIQVLCESTNNCAQDTEFNTTPFSVSGTGTRGDWQDAVDAAGTVISATDDYLTLTNARQAFILLGGFTYALTIDGGTMFTIDVTETAGDSLSPTDLVQLTAL